MSRQNTNFLVNSLWELVESDDSIRHLRVLGFVQRTRRLAVFDLTAYEQSRAAERRRRAQRKNEETAEDTWGDERQRFFREFDEEEFQQLSQEGNLFPSEYVSPLSPVFACQWSSDKSPTETGRSADATKATGQSPSWNLISLLVTREMMPLLVDPSTRGACIARHAEQQGCDPMKVYRTLYRYFAFGMTPQSLMPANHLKGGPGKARSPDAKVGRRPKPSPHQAMNESELRRPRTIQRDLKRFRIAWNRITRTGESLRGSYDWMLVELYQVGEYRDEGLGIRKFTLREGVGPRSFPSYETFSHYYRKHGNAVDAKRRMSTENQYARQHRGHGGNPRTRMFGIAHEYQIDSTPSVCALRSDLDPTRILGLVTIYNIVDTCTNLIVGQYFSWLPPSGELFCQALYVAFTSYPAYCLRFNVALDKAAFPERGVLCSVLRADRQESMSILAETALVETLKITIANPPPARPDLNAFVERMHQLMEQYTQAGAIPGATPKGGRDRGEADPKHKAILTRAEFASVCARAAQYHNRHATQKRGYTKEMMADGVRPYPIDMWNWHLSHGASTPPTISEDELRLSLLPRGTAKVTRKGIEFKTKRGAPERYYSCETALRERWFELAGIKAPWKIHVRYQTDRASTIWILHKERKPEPCTLLNQDDRKDYGFDELEPREKEIMTRTPSEERAEVEDRLGITAARLEAQDKGKDRRKATHRANAGISKAGVKRLQVRDLAEEREHERAEMAAAIEQQLTPGVADAPARETPPSDSDASEMADAIAEALGQDFSQQKKRDRAR